jgi:hypothetical protein
VGGRAVDGCRAGAGSVYWQGCNVQAPDSIPSSTRLVLGCGGPASPHGCLLTCLHACSHSACMPAHMPPPSSPTLTPRRPSLSALQAHELLHTFYVPCGPEKFDINAPQVSQQHSTAQGMMAQHSAPRVSTAVRQCSMKSSLQRKAQQLSTAHHGALFGPCLLLSQTPERLPSLPARRRSLWPRWPPAPWTWTAWCVTLTPPTPSATPPPPPLALIPRLPPEHSPCLAPASLGRTDLHIASHQGQQAR